MSPYWKCPRCGRVTQDYPSLSRRDNKTSICGQCGIEESMSDYHWDQMEKKSKGTDMEFIVINQIKKEMEAEKEWLQK